MYMNELCSNNRIEYEAVEGKEQFQVQGSVQSHSSWRESVLQAWKLLCLLPQGSEMTFQMLVNLFLYPSV